MVVVEAVVVAVVVVVVHLCICAFVGISGVSGVVWCGETFDD